MHVGDACGTRPANRQEKEAGGLCTEGLEGRVRLTNVIKATALYFQRGQAALGPNISIYLPTLLPSGLIPPRESPGRRRGGDAVTPGTGSRKEKTIIRKL